MHPRSWPTRGVGLQDVSDQTLASLAKSSQYCISGTPPMMVMLNSPTRSTCLYQLEDGIQQEDDCTAGSLLPPLTDGQRCLHYRSIQVLLMIMATTRVPLMACSRPASTADYLVPGMSARRLSLCYPAAPHLTAAADFAWPSMIKLPLMSQLAGTGGLPGWGVYTVD